jgi:hypothetical protein
MIENRVLRRIFGPKEEEVTGDWRKLRSDDDQINEGLMDGNLTRMGKMRNAYKILVGKPEGKRPLRRSRRRW